MNSIILEEAKELAGWDGQGEVLSIYGAMQQLKDGRRKQGKRYPLALILTYLLLAKAAGETTLQASSEWIRLRGEWLQQVLPQAVLPWDMVDKSTGPFQAHFGPVFGDEAVQRGLLFPE